MLKWFLRIFLILLLDIIVSCAFLWNSNLRAHFSAPLDAVLDVGIVFYSGEVAKTRRLDKAISDYKAGLLEHLIIVGGCRPKKNFFASEVWRQNAHEQGVPIENIFIGGGSFESKGNLAQASKIVTGKNWANVALYSDPIHLNRIKKDVAKNAYFDGVQDLRLIKTPYDGGAFYQWYIVHYEGAAIISNWLPENLRLYLIKKLRVGGTKTDGDLHACGNSLS